MKIGYIRVSTEEQNTARQEVLLRDSVLTSYSSIRRAAKTQTARSSLG